MTALMHPIIKLTALAQVHKYGCCLSTPVDALREWLAGDALDHSKIE
jgi:hypothetical protein